MSIRKEVSPMEAPCSSGNAQEQLFITDWAPPIHSISIDSLNVGGSNNANVERLPSISCFGSGSLSEIMNSFNLPENTQLGDFPSTVEEKNFKGEKRKKMPDSTEGENEKNVQTGPVKNTKEEDDKKQKNETGDTNKEDYLHIRARRGQATNSHSLAERVRREKISERMRLLQDLVPGCNKITGKAVMLDEIINYVQSLQSQVEFLSMKLATVNPEMNLDINQIIRKENLHSEYGGSSQILGYFPELVSSLPQLQTGIAVPSLPSSRDLIRTANNLQISSMAQIPSPWDNEFQNALQMSFIPNIPHHGMELNGNGSMKEEL